MTQTDDTSPSAEDQHAMGRSAHKYGVLPGRQSNFAPRHKTSSRKRESLGRR